MIYFQQHQLMRLLCAPTAVRMRPQFSTTLLDKIMFSVPDLHYAAWQRQSHNREQLPPPLFCSDLPGRQNHISLHCGATIGSSFRRTLSSHFRVKDIREVLKRAHERLVTTHQETVLFIDEVHRFSKSQQDALLPSVENRDITFIAATTENPSFFYYLRSSRGQ